jgi:hypothetical protein
MCISIEFEPTRDLHGATTKQVALWSVRARHVVKKREEKDVMVMVT